ncbi:MAG: cell division topological specificity factor MinE [Pseudomonadota bacterium]
MGLLDYFLAKPKSSANVARERLQILVAHDRAERGRPSYLPRLQREILEVIRRHVHVDQDAISITYGQDGTQEILELNIVLPEENSR